MRGFPAMAQYDSIVSVAANALHVQSLECGRGRREGRGRGRGGKKGEERIE